MSQPEVRPTLSQLREAITQPVILDQFGFGGVIAISLENDPKYEVVIYPGGYLITSVCPIPLLNVFRMINDEFPYCDMTSIECELHRNGVEISFYLFFQV